jgi:APA family basic amino acid/polyamine antiporter
MGHGRSLRRRFGAFTAAALVVGGTIGTSIFVIPSAVAAAAGSPGMALAVWTAAGLLAATASLCLAELAAAIPETGGVYAFLRRAWRSELVAFSYAWMMCFAYGPAAMAVVATMSATFAAPYLERALGRSAEPVRATALALIGLAALVNVVGARAGGLVQAALTFAKVALLLAVIAVPLALSGIDLEQIAAQPRAPDVGGVAGALMLCLFAYSGSHFVTLVGGEVRDPGRAIPRAILGGAAVVMGLYLLFNLAILASLPFEAVAGSPPPCCRRSPATRARFSPAWSSSFRALPS